MKRKRPYKKAILAVGGNRFALISPSGVIVESQRLEDIEGYLDRMQHGESACRRFRSLWRQFIHATPQTPAAVLMGLATNPPVEEATSIFRLEW